MNYSFIGSSYSKPTNRTHTGLNQVYNQPINRNKISLSFSQDLIRATTQVEPSESIKQGFYGYLSPSISYVNFHVMFWLLLSVPFCGVEFGSSLETSNRGEIN